MGVVRELADHMLGFLRENRTRQDHRRRQSQAVTVANREAIIANLKGIEELDSGQSTSKSQEAATDPPIQVGTDLVDGLPDTAPLPIKLKPKLKLKIKRTRGSPDRPPLSDRTNVHPGTRKRLLTTKAKEGSDSPVGLHVPMCHVNNCE